MIEQALYLPHPDEEYEIDPRRSNGELPIPPPHLMEYEEPPDQHLAMGKQDMGKMLSALEEHNFEWETCQRALEFGCSNGKMLRWLADYAEGREMWGVDVQADKILWAAENLSPPFHFATTTTVPHLPFPDQYFDLIFATSVFTHIGELHVAWFLELARILNEGGLLYVTIHDEASARAAMDGGKLRRIGEIMEASESAEALRSGDFGFVSIAPYGKAMLAQVMMGRNYVEHVTAPFLRLLGTAPEAYSNFQTGYIFTQA